MNVKKTIDKLVEVEPTLGPVLIPIKAKCGRHPKYAEKYLKEAVDKINECRSFIDDSKWEDLRLVLNQPKKRKKTRNTFLDIKPDDRVVGALPEHFSDKLKRYDRSKIELEKYRVEAVLTHDQEAFSKIAKRSAKIEIQSSKLWQKISDYFDLWTKPGNYVIRQKDTLLVLAEEKAVQSPVSPRNKSGNVDIMLPDSSFMRMDPDILRKFFKFLGITPPPGLFPNDENGE